MAVSSNMSLGIRFIFVGLLWDTQKREARLHANRRFSTYLSSYHLYHHLGLSGHCQKKGHTGLPFLTDGKKIQICLKEVKIYA